MTRKPNLLLRWTDEQRADTLDCCGDQSIAAPHHNRWHDAKYLGRRDDLLARLRQWQSASGDKLAPL